MASSLRSIFRFRRRRRVKLEHEREPMSKRTRILLRLLLAAVVLGATVAVFPLRETFTPLEYVEGSVSGDEVIAPFTFDVTKTEDVLERERTRAAEAVLPAFVRDPGGNAYDSRVRRLERAVQRGRSLGPVADTLNLSLSTRTLSLLAARDTSAILLRETARVLDQAEVQGLVGSRDANLLRGYNRVRVGTPEGEEVIPTFQIYDFDRLIERATERGTERLGAIGGAAVAELAQELAVANLAYDPVATEEDRRAARSAVSPVIETVQQGERIIDAHERITAEHVLVLQALQRAMGERSAGRGLSAILLPLAGRAALVLAVFTMLSLFLRDRREKTWDHLGNLTLITVVGLLVLALAGVAARSTAIPEVAVPIPMVSVVLTLLLGPGVAMAVTLALAGLIAAVSGWGIQVALIGAVGGVLAAYSLRHVLHRMEFLRSILPISVGMGLTFVGTSLVGPGMPWTDLLGDLVWIAGSAVFSVAAAMFLLPLFERMFGMATNITLLELSDLNRPIFKRMMLEANGTYHHSMIVGSLSEAAAEAVGANALLSRVGGYYHDIGKIAKSTYFGENLREGMRNPHEKLTPHMSTLILESHVREGLELAREIGLPQEVAAFIPEHQGTTLMQYFYNKAVEMDPEVEERDYRYPGPRPQTKESGIVMLADASEATVRSLDDHSPNKIRAVLARLFESRISDRQLDECGLTMADLARIRDSFTHVLTGVFHGRVKYQWQKDGGEQALTGSKGPRVFYPELETGLNTRESTGESASTPQTAGRAARS